MSKNKTYQRIKKSFKRCSRNRKPMDHTEWTTNKDTINHKESRKLLLPVINN